MLQIFEIYFRHQRFVSASTLVRGLVRGSWFGSRGGTLSWHQRVEYLLYLGQVVLQLVEVE